MVALCVEADALQTSAVMCQSIPENERVQMSKLHSWNLVPIVLLRTTTSAVLETIDVEFFEHNSNIILTKLVTGKAHVVVSVVCNSVILSHLTI